MALIDKILELESKILKKCKNLKRKFCEEEEEHDDINVAFKSAVDKANSDLRSAISVASTPLQKSTAAANRRNAIDLAINARDLAISALGPMPTPPVEPIREDKQKSDKGQVEKNRR